MGKFEAASILIVMAQGGRGLGGVKQRAQTVLSLPGSIRT
jgi:hypothetical protein